MMSKSLKMERISYRGNKKPLRWPLKKHQKLNQQKREKGQKEVDHSGFNSEVLQRLRREPPSTSNRDVVLNVSSSPVRQRIALEGRKEVLNRKGTSSHPKILEAKILSHTPRMRIKNLAPRQKVSIKTLNA